MAAPKSAGDPTIDTARSYRSPDHVPDTWTAARPGYPDARQPRGALLGTQGPDQGYALLLANRLVPQLRLQPGEHLADVVRGCLTIALRRASIYGRAPVLDDFAMAFTMWGFLDDDPPAELVATRGPLFEGVGNVLHHYAEGRRIADLVPEATLRSTLDAVAAGYPARWRELTGA